jgi:hypothetical protein
MLLSSPIFIVHGKPAFYGFSGVFRRFHGPEIKKAGFEPAFFIG